MHIKMHVQKSLMKPGSLINVKSTAIKVNESSLIRLSLMYYGYSFISEDVCQLCKLCKFIIIILMLQGLEIPRPV